MGHFQGWGHVMGCCCVPRGERTGRGRGQATAQLFPASVRRKPGAGGSPGFPAGPRWARFISTPTPAACGGGRDSTVGKEARREPGLCGTARGTRHGQGARCLAMAPGASRTTRGNVDVALAGLCVLLLCCSPVLAGCHRVTFSPATLTRPAGGSATFFCNISIENNSSLEYNLNWYKETNHSDPQKIAQIRRSIPQTKTEKYLLSNHTPVFKIEILNLHQNDSGSYYCGLIAFFQPNKVEESNRSHLVVTAAPEKINTTEEPGVEDSSPPSHIKAVILGVLLLGCVVVLVVLGYCIVTYRRGDVQKPPSENAAEKEEKPPVVSVSTVDYGVLEFQWDPHTQLPPETRPDDQTEYATIIFPEEKPVTPERGKRHLDERTWQPPSQPC
ncbi:programmed cell death protein 1 isoform X1 [Anser cygnoides]|uniref:programmed cell death protein 1 isoform X1 n=1 Tax=Anser cygnoides TaxID=8845 RepID=UPI0034D27BE7